MSLLLDALKQAEENKKKSAVKIEPSAPLKSNSALQLEGNEPIAASKPEISLLEPELTLSKPSEPEIDEAKVEIAEAVKQSEVVEPSAAIIKPDVIDVLAVGKKPAQPAAYKKLVIVLLLVLVAGVISLFLLEDKLAPVSSYKETLAAQKEKPAQLAPPVIVEPIVEPLPIEPVAVDKEVVTVDDDVQLSHVEPEIVAAIKITKRATSSIVLNNLERAYKALLGHELDRAWSLYQQVLAAQPRQVDALLGLANIASQRQNKQQARALYEKVLQLDAANNTAQIGLLQTFATQDVFSRQQVLEDLITKQPDNPEAYLALGHALSEQAKWKVAQQMYFKAFSLNPKNTVYAYNLAVSLDSLGQYKAAISYYEKSLSLNDLAAKPLNLERVSNRLMELSNAYE